MSENKPKVFVFPENVSSSYGVFLGLSLKELAKYVLPVIVVGVLSFLIPPQSLKATIVKIIIFILLITIVLGALSSQPVAYRSNIKLLTHLRLKRNYNRRQRLFFEEKKRS